MRLSLNLRFDMHLCLCKIRDISDEIARRAAARGRVALAPTARRG
jgi:hypothetical protein